MYTCSVINYLFVLLEYYTKLCSEYILNANSSLSKFDIRNINT